MLNYVVLILDQNNYNILRAYSSYTSNSSSTLLKRIYYYARHAYKASILNIILNLLDKRTLRAIMLAMLDK